MISLATLTSSPGMVLLHVGHVGVNVSIELFLIIAVLGFGSKGIM